MPRSTPRYKPRSAKAPAPKASPAPKGRPLELKRTSHSRFWGGLAFRWIVLYTALPLAALWAGDLLLNPYRIYFDSRPSGVTLDGAPVSLDSARGFNLSRFASGEHLLRYVDAEGAAKAVRLHARLSDTNGELAIGDNHLDGLPKAEFVNGR